MENKKEFILNVLFYALIFGLAYLFCNYLLGIFAPFLIGFLFALAAVKIASKLFKSETKLVRILSLILLFIVIIGVVSLFTALGINELIEFIGSIPNLYKQYVEPVLLNLNKNANLDLPFGIEADLNGITNDLLESIKTLVSNISTYIVSGATSLISNTTNILVSALTLLITAFYVAADYENIINYLKSLFQGKTKALYEEVSDFLLNTVFLVIRSYGLIMLITFIELLIGFLILGIDNFALIALITAFLDILPILGVGTVLIPWGIFEMVVGNIALGVELIVLYLVITIIRNIIEPKLVGGSLDLHPLATLFAMLVGLSLFGVLGMFGLPLVTSFFVKREQRAKVEAK